MRDDLTLPRTAEKVTHNVPQQHSDLVWWFRISGLLSQLMVYPTIDRFPTIQGSIQGDARFRNHPQCELELEPSYSTKDVRVSRSSPRVSRSSPRVASKAFLS